MKDQNEKLNALLTGEPVPAIGSSCKVAQILEELEEPYLSALTALLASSAAELVESRLRSAGFAISATTIRKHRRGVCSCPKGI
jgi:hypothetical protein